MIKIASLTLNPFGENTYVLSADNGDAIIVDAGCYSAAERQRVAAYIEKNSLHPILALNTHAHIDHVCGVEWVKSEWGIPFALHEADLPILSSMITHGEALGFQISSIPAVEQLLTDGQQIPLGDKGDTIRIIHTPGHSAGGVSIYIESQKMLLTGDTLFDQSIGRTDLPSGDYPTLMRSIVKKLLPLGGDVKIFPGHGGASDLARQITGNPFVSEVLNGDFKYEN